MGPWTAIAGAGLGAIGGAMQKKPRLYDEFDQITDAPYREDYGRGVLDYLRMMSLGGQPLMNQAEINRMTSGARGRLDADAAAARMRINERNMGLQGRIGGMQQASMDELDRALLGQKRQLEAGVQNTLAAQAPGMRLQAAGMGLNFLGGQEGLAAQEHRMLQDSLNQRAGFSRGANILGGALAGFGMGGGLGAFGKKQSGGQDFPQEVLGGIDRPAQDLSPWY